MLGLAKLCQCRYSLCDSMKPAHMPTKQVKSHMLCQVCWAGRVALLRDSPLAFKRSPPPNAMWAE